MEEGHRICRSKHLAKRNMDLELLVKKYSEQVDLDKESNMHNNILFRGNICFVLVVLHCLAAL